MTKSEHGAMDDALIQLAKDRRALRALVATGEARELRLRAGLTLREVGDAVGVLPSTVWRWEHGERTPRGKDLAAYVTILRELERVAP